MKRAKVLGRDDVVVQEFEWGMLHWYASGQIGNSEEMTVGKCIIRPGCENPLHQHPNCEEVLHVLSGRISHYVAGGEDYEMRPGDTISIPPGVSHNARNIGPDDAVMMIAFSSPHRETQGE
jgi:quercetin dioxygenase-like cupin family protein